VATQDLHLKEQSQKYFIDEDPLFL